MECKYCQKSCREAGLTVNNIQRYYCVSCKRYQQQSYHYIGCEAYVENRIVQLNNESCGIRSISRILRISTGKVLSTIKYSYKQQRSLKHVLVRGREYELDEMKTFIKRKKDKYWIVWMMKRIGLKNSNNRGFQFWQQDSYPIELWSDEVFHQKLNYIHMNPVVSGFVAEAEHWLYSSARNHAGLPGILKLVEL